MVPSADDVWKMHDRFASSSLRYQDPNDVSALPNLFTGRLTDDILHARVECTLRQANEEAQYIDRRDIIGARKTECQHTPDQLHAGNPSRRPDSCKYHVTWQLANNVADGPACLHVVELVLV